MSVRISRVLHAGYIFETEDARILFDPIFENPFSKNCFAFPPVRFDLEGVRSENFDAVFISHFHDDHCSFESLDLLDRATPIYIFCVHDEMLGLLRDLGFADVHSLSLGAEIAVGDIRVTPLRALDADVDSIFHLRVGDLNILNVVDSWIDEEILSELQGREWDLVLWPFQTMRELEVISPRFAERSSRELPAEWLEQIRALQPKQIAPSSCQFVQEDWSWYNGAFFPISYEIFAREMSRVVPDTEVVRLNPGEAIELSSSGFERRARLPWIEPIGSQEVDYSYAPAVGSTAEIARHFSLDAEKSRFVHDYCFSGLLARYAELGEPEGRYFRRKRIWKLSVFYSAGNARVYFYRLDEDSIERWVEAPAEWTTEIPEAKLYAALIDGETLTSLYIRVNDGPFLIEVESELASQEVIDDPLIRCLYNGVFGAYQRAQLKRLGRFRE